MEPAPVHFFCLSRELGSDLFLCELIHMLNAKSEMYINERTWYWQWFNYSLIIYFASINLLTFSNLRDIIFGLFQVFIHQSEMSYHLDVIVMSDFSLSIISNSVSTSDTQIFDASQQIGVGYHVPNQASCFNSYFNKKYIIENND